MLVPALGEYFDAIEELPARLGRQVDVDGSHDAQAYSRSVLLDVGIDNSVVCIGTSGICFSRFFRVAFCAT